MLFIWQMIQVCYPALLSAYYIQSWRCRWTVLACWHYGVELEDDVSRSIPTQL